MSSEPWFGALRAWTDEDVEGRVMTVVEDPSVVDYVTSALGEIERLRGIYLTARAMLDNDQADDAALILRRVVEDAK